MAQDANVVRLCGRVSGAPEHTVLPSGDEVVALRVVVRRDVDDRAVDTIPVRVGPAPPQGRRPRDGQVGRRLLTAAARLPPHSHVEVEGWLRRRWWDAGGARHSRIEVQATSVTPIASEASDDGDLGAE